MVAGSSASDGQQAARPVQVAGELLEQAGCGGRVAHWSRRPNYADEHLVDRGGGHQGHPRYDAGTERMAS